MFGIEEITVMSGLTLLAFLFFEVAYSLIETRILNGAGPEWVVPKRNSIRSYSLSRLKKAVAFLDDGLKKSSADLDTVSRCISAYEYLLETGLIRRDGSLRFQSNPLFELPCSTYTLEGERFSKKLMELYLSSIKVRKFQEFNKGKAIEVLREIKKLGILTSSDAVELDRDTELVFSEISEAV